ncbi:hypothetical protein AS361_03710 [Myroides marinus]|uniref:hypothetical protein n=1 Tax=Myroides marinus TaxID=703342 RepID=UPI000741A9FF|nr:hypothetical protein [Myroides marinus]KUF38963.1 hypothetical protein AS361_03710 [Myroides marinus]
MSYDLRENNLGGLSVIKDTNNELVATPHNFINLYDYAMHYQPELIPDLVYANGKGSILGFLRATAGSTGRGYESDMIQHAEVNRLHNSISGVTIVNNEFSCPKPHNLRVNDVIKLSDGENEYQAIVSQIVSKTKFIALNDAVGAFPTKAVTVNADFSSRFLKGDKGFKEGRHWKPTIFTNYSHIFKEYYGISDSDLAHRTWINTPEGPRWFSMEMERTNTLYDNKNELTFLTHERADDNAESTKAGFAQGMNGVIPIIETRGNISNDFIESVEDLSNMALRLKQQGTCRELTLWMGHTQMAKIRKLASSINASFVNGSNYGAFNNSKDMALNLDFVSIFVDGVQFHFVSWAILDDPTLLGATNFDKTSFAYVAVPSGNTFVTENGNTVSKPYLELRYRKNNLVNREKEVKFFGKFGQQVEDDKSYVTYLTEGTVDLTAANNFFVGRKSDTFYL